MKHVIKDFWGEYRFLSNFHPAEVKYCNRIYPTSEHAYQAAKSTKKYIREYVASLETPGKAKRYGQNIALRPHWEELKIGIMYRIVYNKFKQNPDLRKLLLATKSAELIEGNTWNDTFWGVCKGKGTNWMGVILMQVRSQLI
jgi:ribA/ribD-fused uncharacterized protein